MSVEAITWALKQPVPRPLAKFVLVMLANLAGPDKRGNVVAWPSIKYLRDATGMDRKTVQAGLLLLREAGLIEDMGERVGATGSVIVYRLNCGPDLFTGQAQKRSRPKNGAAPKVDASSPKNGAKRSQKRDTDTKRPVITQSREGKAGKQKRPPLTPTAFAALMQEGQDLIAGRTP